MNPKVDFFFNKESKWQTEYIKLRSIALECMLIEELKWGCPCYTFNGGNIILIHGFKEYCAYLFFKGALLGDTEKILVQQSNNVQAGRQIRFTSINEINNQEAILKAYIFEAIEIEKNGLEINFKKTSEYEMVEEFKQKLISVPFLNEAFYKLTPGRQRAYLLYFSQAKQVKTREARIEKFIPNILNGKGLDD